MRCEFAHRQIEIGAAIDIVWRRLHMRLPSIFSAPRRFHELIGTIESLRTETSELRTEISELRAQMKPVNLAPPGHFYSPLVNPNDDVVQDVLAGAARIGLPDS